MRNFSRAGGLPASVRKLTLALGATIAIGGASTLSLAQAQQQPPTFSAYPMPGTLTAHAKTAISFRGGDQAALGTVTVKGSRSGDHPGTFKPHSDGQGVSFVPNKAFDENERVTVTTDRNVVNAANGDFSFEIGDETTRTLRPVEAPDVGRGTVQSFRTRPDLDPPSVTVTTAKPGPRARASSSSRPRRGAARTAR